jgi:hypothetical protein
MRSKIVLENMRRLSAITSLFNQAADGRRAQKIAPPEPAEELDQVVLAQLESYFWRTERRQPVF